VTGTKRNQAARFAWGRCNPRVGLGDEQIDPWFFFLKEGAFYSNLKQRHTLFITYLHHSKLRAVDQRPTENQYLTQKLNLARLCATLLDSV
jgi:hypothetical protein